MADKLKILGDSACDLTRDLEEQLDAVRAVPFFIEVGGETLVDDDALSIPDLLQKMRVCVGKMGSACPSPIRWMDAFLQAGGGFAVTLSSKLSGMYQAAKIGLEMAKAEVSDLVGHVFDSRSAACGEVLLALKIRQLADSGLPFDAVVKKAEQFIHSMKTFILLEDTGNLVKNGRMSKVAGALATVLGIRPVLCGKDGEIALFDKLRGSANLAGKLLDCVLRGGHDRQHGDLVISHCNNPALANAVRDEAEARGKFARVHVIETRGLTSLYACDKGLILSF